MDEDGPPEVKVSLKDWKVLAMPALVDLRLLRGMVWE